MSNRISFEFDDRSIEPITGAVMPIVLRNPATGEEKTAFIPAPDEDAVCDRCKGSKLVTLYDTYMGDADDQPCPNCTEWQRP